MTTASSAPTRAVVIRRSVGHCIEARDAATGRLLGTAVRQSREGEWPGWYVECGGHREWMTTAAAAADTLARLASDVDGA